jgi:lipopolysaccharide biosynthesis regulator YciM
MKQEKLEEATPLARQAFVDLDRNYDGLHRRVAYVLRLLGQLAQTRHNWEEAELDFSREIAVYRKINDNADLPIALSNLADVEVQRKDHHAAETLYQEAIEKFPHTEWADSADAARAGMMLGELRVVDGRYGEAELPLLTSLAQWQKSHSHDSKEMRETLLDLIQTYQGLRQPEKEKKYRQLTENLTK